MTLKSAKILKIKAHELLFAKGNYLCLVLAFILLVAFCTMPLIAVYLLDTIVDDNLLTAALFFLEVFLSIPLIAGIRRMAVLSYKNRDFGMIELFFAFSSVKNYFRVLLVNLVWLFKTITPISVGVIVSEVIAFPLKAIGVGEMAFTVIYVAIVLTSILLFLPLCKKFYAVSFLVLGESEGVFAAIKRSWTCTKGTSMRLSLMELRLLPATVLSLAFLMLPFMLYVFPLRLCLYSVICGDMKNENMRKSDNYKIQNDICPEASAEGVEEINEQYS